MADEVADDLAEMMSLQGRSATTCGLCHLIKTMKPEHVEALQAALLDERVNSTGMLKWLGKHGYTIEGRKDPAQVLRHHRNKHLA